MHRHSRALPGWFSYFDLACAVAAGGLWFALPRLGAAGVIPLAVGLAPWAVRLAWSGRLTRRTAFDLPLALFLVTAVAGVWAAFDRSAAWTKLWLLVGGVLLFYALSNAEPRGMATGQRVGLVGALGAGVTLAFLLTHDWDALPAKVDALTRLGKALQGPFPGLTGERLHPNIAAGTLVLTLPFAGMAALQAWRGMQHAADRARAVRALWLAAAVLALALTAFGVLMTTSRGAWLALAGALALAGVWHLSGWLSSGRAGSRALVFPSLLVMGLAVALGIAAIWPGAIAAVWNALPGPSTGGSRLELMQNTVRMVRDYPLVGVGLGGFQLFYSTYVLLLHVGYITHSHNLLLDVAIEQGLPALLLLMWMWGLFLRGAWRGLVGKRAGATDDPTATGVATSNAREGAAPGGRAALGAAALALVAVLLHGLVDDALYSSRAALFLFVPLAFAVPFVEGERRRDRRWLTLGLPIGLLLIMAVAMIWRGPLLSLVPSNLGAVHQSQAELTPYRWPEWPIQDAVRRAVDLSRPVAEFERALVLDARNPTANRRLGMIELSLGEYEDALVHLQAAYAVEPGFITTRQLLGEALIANGYVDEGRALWATVRTSEGQLDARIWWYLHIGDPRRSGWMQRAASGQR